MIPTIYLPSSVFCGTILYVADCPLTFSTSNTNGFSKSAKVKYNDISSIYVTLWLFIDIPLSPASSPLIAAG